MAVRGLRLSLLCLGSVWATAQGSEPTAAPRAGEVLFTLDPAKERENIERVGQIVKEGPGGGECIRANVTPEDFKQGKAEALIKIPLDMSRWKGAQIVITAKIRGESISKPEKRYNGAKLQIFYKTSDGADKYTAGLSQTFGTFDWKEVALIGNTDDGASGGLLQLGLQESSGTIWFSDVVISVVRPKPVRPKPSACASTPAPTKFRGVMAPSSFKVEDYDTLAGWNVNLVRWQATRNYGKTNTELDLEDYGKWIDGKLDEFAKVLDAAAARGIKVIFDLHTPPGGRTDDGSVRLYLEKPYQDYFVELWKRIAQRFKGHPALMGYDLVNEPIQKKPSPPGVLDWYDIQALVAKEIRKIDPDVKIIFETDLWSSASQYANIEPLDVPGVVYQVHMYWPGVYTHQGVKNTWGVGSNGKQGIEYPGTIDGSKIDREALRRNLAAARDFQRAYNVPMYVGEFSAVRWAPGAAQYLDDLISIYEEYGWDWTYHAFREWPGWSVEHANLPYDRDTHPKAEQPTDRFLVLKKWFDKNKKEPLPPAADPATKK